MRDILETITAINAALDEQGAPAEGRILVITEDVVDMIAASELRNAVSGGKLGMLGMVDRLRLFGIPNL